MPNSFLPPKVFANAALAFLKNNLVMAKLCDSEGVDKEFKAPVGGTVYVKRPPEFTVRNGPTASVQDVIEGEVAVNVNIQRGVDVQFTSVEETLNVDALMKSRMMNAAMSQLATDIDMNLIARVNEFHNFVGTAGNTISTPLAFNAAPQRLDEMAVPGSDRNAVLAPDSAWSIVGNLAASAAQSDSGVAETALKKAKLPMLGNVDAYQTQTVPSIVTGTRTNGAVNGAAQNVAYTAVRSTYSQTLAVDGLGANATIAAGEVFTLAGVFAVNPRTKASLPYLQQFTVLTAATASAGGAVAALEISPPIITSGAFQNVSAVPADNAVLTWYGSAGATLRSNAAFHKNAIKLVSAKLVMPYTGEASYATDPDTGLTIRYWRYSDGANDTHNHRFDVLFGTVNADRRLGTRINGA